MATTANCIQKWAVEQVDSFVTAKRTADGSIDGLESVMLEVKGDKNVNITVVQVLRGMLVAHCGARAPAHRHPSQV